MLPQKHFCGQFFETVTGETSQAQDPAFDNRSALTHAAGSPCCAPLQGLRLWADVPRDGRQHRWLARVPEQSVQPQPAI